MIFTVWAPFANSVDMLVGGARLPLCRDANGGWRIELEESMAAAGYLYSIDGGEAVPDPGSLWQPHGVHGASHPVRLDRLRIHHAAPFRACSLAEAVIYEMHVGTFTPDGTLAAAAEKLEHLVQLGVTHVELMPVATFPGGHGWGYDGVYWYAPFPGYGTPRQLAAFVDACHFCGLAVLLDVVYNHLGPDGNYLARFGPYFSDRVKTGWGDAINYDGPSSDGVRRFVVDNALMWLRDYGFDGLRLDAVHAIFCCGAVHVLEELADAVERLAAEAGRSIVLIAESDSNDPRLVHSRDRGGYALDAQWADDLHHSIHRFFTGETAGYYADFNGLADVALALQEGYVYQGQYSSYRRRRHGHPPVAVGADQLVVCAQNHDQIGNRALGDRLSMLVGTPQLKAIAALVLLSPFVPLLFQGEEWGARTPFLYFTDHLDPQLALAVAQGRREEFAGFGWQEEVPNPQERASFTRSKLDWSEIAIPRHADLLAWHQQLIRLRRRRALGSGCAKAQVNFDEQARWLTVTHAGILAVFNFAPQPQSVPLPPGAWQIALCSDSKHQAPPGSIGGWQTRVFTLA